MAAKELIILQRNDANTAYTELKITASNAALIFDSTGHLGIVSTSSLSGSGGGNLSNYARLNADSNSFSGPMILSGSGNNSVIVSSSDIAFTGAGAFGEFSIQNDVGTKKLNFYSSFNAVYTPVLTLSQSLASFFTPVKFGGTTLRPSDVSSSFVVYLPNVNSTLAALNATQSWIGDNTFNGRVQVNGGPITTTGNVIADSIIQGKDAVRAWNGSDLNLSTLFNTNIEFSELGSGQSFKWEPNFSTRKMSLWYYGGGYGAIFNVSSSGDIDTNGNSITLNSAKIIRTSGSPTLTLPSTTGTFALTSGTVASASYAVTASYVIGGGGGGDTSNFFKLSGSADDVNLTNHAFGIISGSYMWVEGASSQASIQQNGFNIFSGAATALFKLNEGFSQRQVSCSFYDFGTSQDVNVLVMSQSGDILVKRDAKIGGTTIHANSPTGTYIATLPSKTGTIAFLDDVGGGSGTGSIRIVTFPPVSSSTTGSAGDVYHGTDKYFYYVPTIGWRYTVSVSF